jgi:putative copper export protein
MTFFELIETFLDPLLTTSYGETLFSVGFLFLTVLILGLFNVTKTTIITVAVTVLLLFITFGWIPLWFIFLLGVVFLGLIILSLQGGSRDV